MHTTPQQMAFWCYRFGPRTYDIFRELLILLTSFNLGMIASDDWVRYAREFPKEMPLIGKIFTQRIVHNNLILCTRIQRLNRKTSSAKINGKSIGTFIEKYMFY
ncbi:IS1 transposase [Edwardsiella ictaluri 93-146]|uniref:IS1 transposase n=1 Tax=Edwardsiella ictaluri (strain 93-146) TaxID=634503 RepID=C5BCP4_EDWI9|nr:IS1 transposase [Edwardsiella ictaluri 93-146]